MQVALDKVLPAFGRRSQQLERCSLKPNKSGEAFLGRFLDPQSALESRLSLRSNRNIRFGGAHSSVLAPFLL
jgi:hypothetical protein